MIYLDFFEDFADLIKPFRSFVNENSTNPFFWLAIVGVVLAVFYIAYNFLHKGE